MTKIGLKRLQAVARFIQKHPRKFDMQNFCGSQQCIAGLICRQAGFEHVRGSVAVCTDGKKSGAWSTIACELLGFKKCADGADELFYVAYWPKSESNAYYRIGREDGYWNRIEARAKLALERISKFSKKYASEKECHG